MSKRPQISDERKMIYYLGAIVMGVGFLLFLSNFFVSAFQSHRPLGFSYNPIPGMAFRGIGGMLLMAAGAYLRNIGARGAAGSGLILDPERAREDLKPWAQTAGGLVKDALDEVRGEAAQPEPPAVVKVRCPQCRTLNDEDAKFCKGCATPL